VAEKRFVAAEMKNPVPDTSKRIGFVATRISGSDGVSLEIAKWAEVLEGWGYTCYYVTGQSDRATDRSWIIPEAHFNHPVVEHINERAFGTTRRTPELSSEIHKLTWVIKEQLHTAISRLNLDLIVAENCVTMPLNIPLGLAVVEVVMERGMGCIAHHHDFVWERERFLVNAVSDYLSTAFPPCVDDMQHVVINSQAAREFSRRTSLPCQIIPNVMDFDHPPAPADEYVSDFREKMGLSCDDILVLQPTRIVKRKGIEHSIELVRELNDPRCKLVITHAAGDEGSAYLERIRHYADVSGVPLVLADSLIDYHRGVGPDGEKRYSISDAYTQADFVTYPSIYEGFGNAFLEAVYYRKPVFCNRYGIYRTDIEPCGFRVISMDGFLTDDVVGQVRRVLQDKEHTAEMVDHNYNVGQRFFSYRRVEGELRSILAKPHLTSGSTGVKS